MFLRSDGGLRSIRMRGSQLLAQSAEYLVAIVRQVHIILFVDSFQLRVEATNHHVLEAVGLNLGPVFHLIRRNILRIASDIIRSEGIRSLGTDSRHQLVILVGDEILSSHLRHTVNLVVGLTAGSRVGQLAVDLVATLNLVEQGSLSLWIGCTEQPGALEHQMFQIVGQARRLGGVVLRPRAHGNIGLNTRLVLID